ncbi:N-hydroxyarylamine O-acetyltransferase [Gandjariella thermophila]|uniref:N-hydroxyarylamine O-acetyltransferase n=2 Tax=Gandjariella thermophila TaxID=1931992 RepID=A0A4D4JC61_9PSEU|nr:N-hydroxyarylamine O-acetyltransferase [Gandjariella thermophila]
MVNAYLARIGARRPAAPTPEALADLHERHLLAVPFENLSVHLGERVVLSEDALVDKIVRRRRGGFCYELNGAFAALLRALGYRVTLLAGRVFDEHGRLGPPYDHLALRVDAGEPLLVDVGFGQHTRRPLRLDEPVDQRDPDGVFRIVPAAEGDVDVLRAGEPQYRLETRARTLADFTATCWWHQTSPHSYFTRSLVCSMPTATGRITLSGNRLIRTRDGRRAEQVLDTDAAVLAAYRRHFGLHLDRVPAVS